MEETTTIKVKCFYCLNEEFLLPENYSPQQGDLIECANCGKSNDFTSLMRVVKRKGQRWAEDQAKELIDKFTKDLKKAFK